MTIAGLAFASGFVRRLMNNLARGLVALALGTPALAATQFCAGQPANLVDKTMSWCASDHGFNEGASCGLSQLSLAGISGLPAAAPQEVLGSTWDRTHMMGATLLAHHKGSVDLAMEAALCCQIHDRPVFLCLQLRRPEIASWLDSH
jgi:hypothetical protein